jgi:hypothetical protein
MIYMAHKPKRRQGRPQGRKETMPVQARVDPKLHEALETLSERNRRSMSAELIIALEKHLAEAGLWPANN